MGAGANTIFTCATRMVAVFLVLTSISGCATYAPDPIDAFSNASDLARRSLDQDEVRDVAAANGIDTATWPPVVWTPDSLTLAALTLNPSLDVARAEWASARASIRTAGAIPNPSLVAGIEHKSDAGALSPWVSTIALTLPIEAPGKRGARLARAEALEAAAAADLDGAVWSVRASVRRALIDLHASSEERRISAEATKASRLVVELVSRRVELGEDSRLERDRALAASRQLEALAIDANNRRLTAVFDLAKAIGVPPSAVLDIELDLTDLSARLPRAPDVRSVHELALTGRSDVIASLARYAAAEAALREEVRRQYPDLKIGPGFGWDQGSATWLIGLDLDLPVFNRNEGPIAEATARRDLAAAQLSELQARLMADIHQAIVDFHDSRDRLGLADQQLEIAERSLAATRSRLDAGAVDRRAPASGELALYASQLERVRAFAAAQKSVARIEDLIQRPLDDIPEDE